MIMAYCFPSAALSVFVIGVSSHRIELESCSTPGRSVPMSAAHFKPSGFTGFPLDFCCGGWGCGKAFTGYQPQTKRRAMELLLYPGPSVQKGMFSAPILSLKSFIIYSGIKKYTFLQPKAPAFKPALRKENSLAPQLPQEHRLGQGLV